MIKIENVDVYGFDTAIRGMRNPMNSWDKSDSYWTYIENPVTGNRAKFEYFVGDADLALMKSLSKAGNDHGKYLRMITVSLDLTAPLYWYKEFDTYKVGTVANSCSTMHKIHAKHLTLADFSCEHLEDVFLDCLRETISFINEARAGIEYAKKEKEPLVSSEDYWWQMIQLLPTSYNQRRTILLNYQVLKNMYHSRKNHKLDEWRTFCEWIETLPYSELICGGVE